MAVFFILGLALLRNRERMRRILYNATEAKWSWLDRTWPAPLLLLGPLVSGLLVAAAAQIEHDPKTQWNEGFAIFRSLFFVAWILRDVQYLQWFSLRRGKHTLVMGALYLSVFYACVSTLLAALGCFRLPERAPFAAFFLPTPVFLLDGAAWAYRPAIWGAAFVAQWLLIAAFINLQQEVLAEIGPSPATLEERTATA